MKHETQTGAIAVLLLTATVCALAGCWTAPVADVQPKGEARLIQRGIPVIAVKDGATVQSIAADQSSLVLNFPEGITATVKPGPQVKNLPQVHAGDRVRVKVAQELSVYVLKNGALPDADGKNPFIRTDAKVLIVEPSYRLLTLQYPNRQVETLKVGLVAKMKEFEAGDAVAIDTTALLALRVLK
jgi:hypothetical protein